MANRDIFDITFDILQRSLSKERANSTNKAENEDLLAIRLHNAVLAEAMKKTIDHKAELTKIRKALVQKYKTAVKLQTNALAQVEGSHRLHISLCRQYEQLAGKRLTSQQVGSERRMKDLVFEVVGEYGKSSIRVDRRQEYLRRTGRTKIALAVWRMNWQRFAVRWKYELYQSIVASRNAQTDTNMQSALRNVVRCVHLNAEKDREEIEYIIGKLGKKIGLLCEKRMVVQSVVKVTKAGKEKNGVLPTQSFRLATNMKELREINEIIKSWVKRGIPAMGWEANQRSQQGEQQEGGGGGGGTTSRPRTVGNRNKKNPTCEVFQSPLLKDFLSSGYVEWLHPASYQSSQWDQIHQELYCNSSGRGGGGSADEFVNFIRCYHAQHTAALFSDRVYFCLEERSLATSVDLEMEQRSVSPDTALLSVLGDHADASKDTKRVALENAITMQMLTTLQEIYVDHPYTYVTHPCEQLRGENASRSLGILRNMLQQPMTVLGFSGQHRFSLPKSNASKTTQIVYKYLPSFPDIIKVRTTRGVVLHFAPATVAQLPESMFFSSSRGVSLSHPERMNLAAYRCPHPHINTLSTTHYLGTLYCPVLSKSVENDTILRDESSSLNSSSAGTPPRMLRVKPPSSCSSTTGDVDHLNIPISGPTPTTTISPGGQSNAGKKEDDDGAGGGDSFLKRDVLPNASLHVMPLSQDCMHSLMDAYLWGAPAVSVFAAASKKAKTHANSNAAADGGGASDLGGVGGWGGSGGVDSDADSLMSASAAGGSAPGSAGGSAGGSASVLRTEPSAFDILPDHARCRYATRCSSSSSGGGGGDRASRIGTASSSNSTSAIVSSAVGSEDLGKLRCSYVLLPDDRSAGGAGANGDGERTSPPRKGQNSSGGGGNGTGTGGKQPPSSKSHPPCFYLLQLYEEEEEEEEEEVAAADREDHGAFVVFQGMSTGSKGSARSSKATAAASIGGGAGDGLSSEVDQAENQSGGGGGGAHEGESDGGATFSLTQGGAGNRAQPPPPERQQQQQAAVSNVSIFGNAKRFDQQDDMLRGIVFEELKSQLKCDPVVVPSNSQSTGRSGKDGNSRRVADSSSTGKSKPVAASSSLMMASPDKRSHNNKTTNDAGIAGDEEYGDEEEEPNATRNAAGNSSNAAIRRRWDPNILSNVCRWRSCLCEAAVQRVGKTKTFKSKLLCPYHLEMKAHLDGKASNSKQASSSPTLESSKYLPRKAPAFSASSAAVQEKKRDMMTIRAASTLLQELWDGKLRTTVRSFTKKIVRDMTARSFLEASQKLFLHAQPGYMNYLQGNTERSPSNSFSWKSYLKSRPVNEQVLMLPNSILPPQPTWAIWKNQAYFDRTLEGQNLSLTILDAILLTEKALSRELGTLMEMKVFPSGELAVVRREVKSFKEHQEYILTKSASDKGERGGGDGDAATTGGAGSGGGGGMQQPSTGYDDLVAILNAENKLCERKLLMMGTKRQEEEDRRVLHMKKVARVRAVEEAQARDPANFRNQRF